jgi:hypothetical protein
LAASLQFPDEPGFLCQNETSTRISPSRRSEADPELNSLVEQLNRFVRLIEVDIDEEERRCGSFDMSDPTYPASLRTLHLRRNNLLATISTLTAKAS